MNQSLKSGFTFPRGCWLIAFSLLFVISSNETAWSASPEATGPRASQEGLASVLQADGTLRAGVAGSFDASGYRMAYGPNGAPRFVTQGSCGTPDWDGQFGVNGTNGDVYKLLVSGNSIFIGGDFTIAGNAAANNVARFDTTTHTWSALSQHTVSGDVNGVNGIVTELVLSGDSLFVGGGFTTAGINVIVFANGLAKFDLSTNKWSALKQGNGNGVNSTVNAMALSGNSLFVVGSFTTANQGGTGATPAITANRAAKFDISTNTWSALSQGDGNGVNSVVYGLAMSGNNLFIIGNFTTANMGGTGATPAITANRVAKFDTSTNIWSALSQGDGNGVNNTIAALAVSGSSIFLGGDFNVVNQGGTGATPAIPANRLAKFDTSTNTWSLLSQGDGNGVSDFDTGGASSAGAVRALAISGNSLFVGGAFNRVNHGGTGATPAILANSLAKFDITTNTWSAFSQGDGTGMLGVVEALAVNGNSLVVGGFFHTVNQGGTGATPVIPANNVAKFDTSTNTWTAFSQDNGNGVNDPVRALAVSGNNIFVGGDFTVVGTINPLAANRVAKFDTMTNTWSALSQGNGNGVNNKVSALAVIGGSLFVGGDFTTANLGGTGATPAITANRVAKFDTNSNTWSALSQGNGNGVNEEVDALAVIGPSLFVGGGFQTANSGGTGGTPAIVANAVAKFDTNTNTWSALSQGNGNGVDGFAYALAVTGNNLFVGGDSVTANFGGTGATPAITAYCVAKFDTATNTWSALAQGDGNGVGGGGFTVRALAANGTSVFAGGVFTTANFGGTGATPAITASNVARFDTTTNTWNALSQGNGNGVNSTVLALTLSDTSVYAGGSFTTANLGGTGGTPAIDAKHVAKFDTAANTWSALAGSGGGNGLSQKLGSPNSNSVVYALATKDCDLWVGGDFMVADNKASQCIARYGAPSSTPTPTPGKLLNIATRLRVQSGENVLIGGFIITGSDPKKVIIRGIGPSLAQFFSGTLDDPTLELFQGNTSLATNNDWKESQAEIEATGIPPGNDKESAIVRTLSPGSYTAVLGGNAGATGIGVVEVYDLDQSANSKLANIASRGFVDTDNNVMIGGLIVGPAGGATTKVVVRAIGPSLTNFGIAGALQDPTLDLVDVNGVTLRSDNDWKDSQQTEIEAASLAPSDTREAALVQTLAPGNYTAIVRGAGNTTGVGLVEVYNLQ